MAEVYDTARGVTSWYLYNQAQVPEQLVDEALIRPDTPLTTASQAFKIDAVSYMAHGAGRFATGYGHKIVDTFFAPQTQLEVNKIYSVTDVITAMNLDPNTFLGSKIQQWNFIDSEDDYSLRTYVYNSSSFRINPN